MGINQYTLEWHMKATGSWLGSILSIVACVAMTCIELRRGKAFSKSTLFTVLIAITGFGSIIMAQGTFIREATHFQNSPEWLISVREFFNTKYSTFLENFFSPWLDLLIICDGLILYVIICCPDKKDLLLSKRAVSVYLITVVVISVIIAILATKALIDSIEPGVMEFGLGMKIGLANYAWIADIAFRVLISFSTAIFHLVFTLRIRLALKKSIKFLEKSNVSTDAAERYRRIILFTSVISSILFVYNIVAQSVLAYCSFQRQLVINFPMMVIDFTFNTSLLNFEAIARYSVKMLFCLKPFAFGVTYIWARYPRDKQRR